MTDTDKPTTRPTMRHVAALAGVGIKTVSRVMNGEPNVSEQTIRKVRDAVERLDYQLDLNAGNLKRANGRTMTLGLLVGSVANPFSGAIHKAIEEVAWERGTAVFAASLDDDPAKEQAIVEAFLRRRVDGLVLTTITKSQSYLAAEVARRTPLVFIDREPVGLSGDTVVSDNTAGAALATRHLIERGHTRIAYFGDRSGIQTARNRHRGFLEELGRAGIPTADAIVVEDLYDDAHAQQAVAEVMAGPNPPTAIFSSQNLVTIGAVRALRDLGRHTSTALVGFDDFPLADMLDPGVTVIAQNPGEIGRVAAERSFARIDGDRSAPTTVTVPTTLIERGSGEIRPQN